MANEMLEDEVQQRIRLEAPKINCWLLRNNSGAMESKDGRQIRFGLGNDSKRLNDNFKSSDLIGITPVLITKEMVGTTIGVFTAVEVKRSEFKATKKLDDREAAQNNFIQWVRSRGGIAGFASSIEEFRRLIPYV